MDDNPSAPVCYRHPHKETYVRCARCDRPICPDCMNQASVGWQCPDCVREGQKSVRRPRTALGGAVGGNGAVTKTLVAVNVLVFIAGIALAGSGALGSGLLGGGRTELHLLGAMWAPPYSVSGGEDLFGLDLTGVAAGGYYRLFTSMFLHYGVIHLLFNMYILWVLGQNLERDLGPGRYLALYLFSGLGGNVLTYLFADMNASIGDPQSWTFSAGASGAIFGLFGAMVVINRKLGRDISGILVVVGLNLVLTFTLPGISWTGHLGGLVTGAALGWALAHAPRKNRGLIQAGGFAVVLLVFVALILYRTNVLLGLSGGVLVG